MAMLKGKCLNCDHKFYHLVVECADDEQVYCPLCEGPTEFAEADLPAGSKWADKCAHESKCGDGGEGCDGCQKNSTDSAVA